MAVLDDAFIIVNELRWTTENVHTHSRDIVLLQTHGRDIVLIYVGEEGASHVKYTWMSHREQR